MSHEKMCKRAALLEELQRLGEAFQLTFPPSVGMRLGVSELSQLLTWVTNLTSARSGDLSVQDCARRGIIPDGYKMLEDGMLVLNLDGWGEHFEKKEPAE